MQQIRANKYFQPRPSHMGLVDDYMHLGELQAYVKCNLGVATEKEDESLLLIHTLE